jgi:hypothetical protein
MSHDDLYESWKRARAATAVPAGFADRVMAALKDSEGRKARPVSLRELLFALLTSRPGRVAVCSLAGAACLFRILHVLALFLGSAVSQG